MIISSTNETKKLQTFSLLFFISVLFYLIFGLLYTWGSPKWFSSFPNASGLRFLLALGLFCLCSAAFFALQLTGPKKGIFGNYYAIFGLSFIPVPVFSILVLCNMPIQILQKFSVMTDIIIWTAGCIVLIPGLRNSTDKLPPGKIWFLWTSFSVCTGILYILALLPWALSIGLRLLGLYDYIITDGSHVFFPRTRKTS